MTDAPTTSPTDWRSRYGFNQGPSQQSQDYWALNQQNGNLGAQSVNQLPFVLDPAKLFGLDPNANKAAMYQPPQAAQGQAGMPDWAKGMAQGAQGATAPQGAQGAQTDPLQQILGLIQQNPQIAQQLMPAILKMQGGQGG